MDKMKWGRQIKVGEVKGWIKRSGNDKSKWERIDERIK